MRSPAGAGFFIPLLPGSSVGKEILLKQGREKQKETLKKGADFPDLSTIDKTEHNTQKEIAEEHG